MIKTMFAWGAATIIVVVSARGQGTFQNLDFEAAHNLPAPGGSVAITNALPGWSAFSGTTQLSTILYNNFAIIREVALYGSNSWAISGHFSVMLNSGGEITQIGLVPVGTKSLFFKKSGSNPAPLGLALSGQNLTYAAISSNPNFTLFGADVSAYAGQMASLSIFAPPGSLHFVDDFEFSPEVIPEPSFLTLLSCGGLLLAANRFIRQRKAPQVIPEPASLVLFGLGVSFLAAHRLHRRRSRQ